MTSTTSALPTAALPPLVDAVVTTPLESLTVAGLQEQYAALVPELARLTGWLGAVQAELHTRTGGQVPTGDGGTRSLAGWLAEAARGTASAAGRQVKTATDLRQHLPGVVEAVLDGRVTPDAAAVLARLIGRIDPGSLSEAEPQLIRLAGLLDPAELARQVRELIATHCEPQLDADQATARAQRYLTTSLEPDGSLRGRFLLPSEDSEGVRTLIEALARKTGREDDRTAAQRRADALVDVCERALRHDDLPDHGGQRPQLSYVLPADWAARQADRAACRDCGPACPAHQPASFADTVTANLPGGGGTESAARGTSAPGPARYGCAVAAWSGPQTRARIETILCDARISRVLLDPSGQVRGLESLTDDLTPRQRRAAAARDLGCVARGCTRPPAMCDAHHLLPRAHGGATTLDNCVLLCRRHHLLWHLGKISWQHLRIPWHPHARTGADPAADDFLDHLRRAGP